MPLTPTRFPTLSPDHHRALAALNSPMTYTDLMGILEEGGHGVERSRMLGVLAVLRQRRLT